MEQILLTQEKPITTNLINVIGYYKDKPLIKSVKTEIGIINICQKCSYGHTNIKATIRHIKKCHKSELTKKEYKKLIELTTQK